MASMDEGAPGEGETFWQFRPFVAGEAAGRIDWRRSAKDERLYVREREWEAAHTVFIWIDRSPSMWFASDLALQPKIDRALVLGLAAADLLVRGGERAGLLGLTPALAVRNIVERFADVLLAQEAAAGYAPEELPAQVSLPRGAQAILIGDFLADPALISATIESVSARGARGHLVMIADPVEETFPFSGNTEFVDVDSPARLRAGQAETFRQEYIRRLGLHREAIGASARGAGVDLDGAPDRQARHRGLACLAGPTRCQCRPRSSCPARSCPLMPGLPLAFHFSVRPRRARGPAALVFSSAHHAAAPGTRAVSAAAAHSGSPPEERDRVAHAIVAAVFASRDRGLAHFRDGGTGAESAARGNRARGVLAHRVGRRLAGGAGLGAQNCRCRTQNRGGGAKLAAHRRRGNIGGGPRHRAPRCGQGARSPAGAQACAVCSRSAAGFFRDRKICRRATKKARDCLDRRWTRSRPCAGVRRQACGCFRRTHCCYGFNNRSRARGRAKPNRPPRCAGASRGSSPAPEQGVVRALDRKGLQLGEASFDFGAANETQASFEMPVELRNEIARLEIAREHSAAAVFLLDERWRRRRIGLVSGETADIAQPLLAPSYYLTKALSPFADIREARPAATDPIRSLLDDHVAIMILADVGMVAGQVHDDLVRFVESGGILVRFAGTHLAAASGDLVPVRLRRGGRVLGGAMSWDTPKKLAPFDRESPFFGLAVPDEVTVSRQVLAEPDPGLSAKTWARLSDGTPLVTAARQGKGLIVLFHVTADTTWSNLPISGLFVDMLRKIVALSGETAKDADAQAGAGTKALEAATFAPSRSLDGFGVLGPPPPNATPISRRVRRHRGTRTSAGFLWPARWPDRRQRSGTERNARGGGLFGVWFYRRATARQWPGRSQALAARRRVSLICRRYLGLALALGQPPWARGARGRLPCSPCRWLLDASRRAVAAESAAASVSPRDIGAALTTRLAYVASGDAKVDEVSRQGLMSLSRVLARRTSLTPGDPVAIDPARDELSFYPLLYWPIVASEPQPPHAAVAKAALFMKQGGTIIFDTRDALASRPGGPPTPEAKWLRALLDGVDVPELEPVPADHVVTKTFYLIDGFVGRYTTGATWIEALPPAPSDGTARPARAGDSVSPIIITANDLAAGWASDPDGDSLYSLVPGGERQHELALRGGVNLVMYTLTGNYKSDQVHVRDLLERLAH